MGGRMFMESVAGSPWCAHHNTRVTAELAIAMTRMWELEAIQTLGAGNAGVVDAATVAEERRYMDFTLPSLEP